MDKYRLYIKKTTSEWSHSGYCSNPNTSYKISEYEDEKTMISVPSIEFIRNYSNEFGYINEAGKEIIFPVYNSCCGTHSSCTDAQLIKIVDGCWLNCFAKTFIEDPCVIEEEAAAIDKNKFEKNYHDNLRNNTKIYKKYYDRRSNIPCKFGSSCFRNKNGTCLYKH